MEQSTEREVIRNVSVNSEANLSTGNEGKTQERRTWEFWKNKDVPQEKRTKVIQKSNKEKEEKSANILPTIEAAENAEVTREEQVAIMEECETRTPTQETVSEQNPSLDVVRQIREAIAEPGSSLGVEAKIEENSVPFLTLEKVAAHKHQNDILGHQKLAVPTVKTASKEQRQIIVPTKKDVTLSTNTATHMELEQRKQQSNSTSRTSLSSLGPSTSSLCHLTELSQPKPEALQTTLNCLRYVNPSATEKLENIRTHLRDLRNRPKLVTCRKSPSSNNLPTRRKTPATASVLKASKDRAAFDRLASRMYEHLEGRWATFGNFQSTMPVQLGYYHAAYDALTRACGKPYTKSSLELYQLLATELGLEAEMFVIDKTPKIDHRAQGNIENQVESMDAPMLTES